MTMTSERRIQILEVDLARHISWIAAADAKTAFLLTLATAMLALEAAVAPAYGKWTRFGAVSGGVAAACLFGSVGCLAATIFPRTEGPKRSLIFFGDVACMKLDDYRSRTSALSDEGRLEDLIEQCHINALIAGKKYTWIRRSALMLYAALLPWVVATLILFSDK